MPFHDTEIKFNDRPLVPVTHEYLRFYIDEKLTWNKHVNYISRKIVPTVGALKRFSCMPSPE